MASYLTHSSVGYEVDDRDKVAVVRVDERFEPGAGRGVLDLQNVRERGGVVLLDDVLERRRMPVVFSRERVLRDRDGLRERQRRRGRGNGRFNQLRQTRRARLGEQASRTGSDE